MILGQRDPFRPIHIHPIWPFTQPACSNSRGDGWWKCNPSWPVQKDTCLDPNPICPFMPHKKDGHVFCFFILHWGGFDRVNLFNTRYEERRTNKCHKRKTYSRLKSQEQPRLRTHFFAFLPGKPLASNIYSNQLHLPHSRAHVSQIWKHVLISIELQLLMT